MRSAVGIPHLPAQAVAEGQGGGGCQPTSRFEQAVPFGLEEYLDLVDTMGRAVHPAKRGAIPSSTPRLLSRLGMDAEAFIACAGHFFKDFASAVGTPAKLIELAAHRQQRCLRGLAAARRVFDAGARCCIDPAVSA